MALVISGWQQTWQSLSRLHQQEIAFTQRNWAEVIHSFFFIQGFTWVSADHLGRPGREAEEWEAPGPTETSSPCAP